jgi:hypothetical protein
VQNTTFSKTLLCLADPFPLALFQLPLPLVLHDQSLFLGDVRQYIMSNVIKMK